MDTKSIFSLPNKDGYEVVNMMAPAHKGFAEIVRKRTRRHTSLVDLLSFDWPEAKEIMNNLYSHISDNIHKNKEPVIYNIIDAALERYHDAVFRKNGKKLDDPKRIAIFVETLVTTTCSEMELIIVNEHGESWSVEVDEPFISWRMRHPGELRVLCREHPNRDMLCKMLYTMLTSDSLKRVLKRAGYEDAVLAGCVAVSG